jgi:CubicO group peptidase (beta-lactamase class C family)
MSIGGEAQRLLESRAAGRAAALAICTGDTVERHHANGGERAFPIYSITKTYIAATALALRDEGRLELDAPIARWLPELAFAAEVTTRQLLQHTAACRTGALPGTTRRCAPPRASVERRGYAARTWSAASSSRPDRAGCTPIRATCS